MVEEESEAVLRDAESSGVSDSQMEAIVTSSRDQMEGEISGGRIIGVREEEEVI